MPRPHRSKSPVRGRLERLESRRVLAATDIEVLAAGRAGDESLALEIDGVEVERWANVGGDFSARQFESFQYTHPTTVTADQVVVRLVDGAGAGRDLRVDGVLIDGVKHQSEAATTWNSGAYSNDLQAIWADYAGSEVIYLDEGAFHYSTTGSAEILVRAAGRTGDEQMRLLIDGAVVQTWSGVGGDYVNRTFQTFSYTHPTKVRPEQVRVEFFGDGTNPDGASRDLRVDDIVIDGRAYESEASTTFGTGVWVDGSITPGFHQRETLHGNGYFQYSSARENGSRLIVWATGAAGDEPFSVVTDGAALQTFTVENVGYSQRQFEPFAVVHPRALSLDEVAVQLLDGSVTPGGVDRNLRVDAIELDGVRHEAEANTTFSTGTWRPGIGVQPGFVQSERVHAAGVLQFGQDPADAGTLSLGATQYEVAEEGGFVDVEFVRTATRGAVTIDYTTVDGTAVAGQDYVAQSGVAVLADGQASVAVRIFVTSDSEEEGSEAFNVAADRVTGGAFLGQPRTTTVTILDDDAPNLGDGIGLLGEYFSGTGFQTPVLQRTDATINFDWGTGSPSSVVPADDFSVRWTGQVEPLYTETYTFQTRTDDGVRLWVNGVALVDQWIDQSPTTHSGTISLTAGVKYDIRMEMYERGGGAVADLRWSSPSQALEIVPTTQLYSELTVPDTGQFTATTVVTGLAQPMAIDFAEVAGSDLMYIAQKNGVVRLAVDGALQGQVVVDYSTPVNDVRDRGLLGMVVHPDLVNNPYLYLLYTYDPPETQSASGLAAPDNYGNRGSRLTRLTLDASDGYRSVIPGSDVVLLGTNSTWENITRPDLDSTQNISLTPSGLQEDGTWIEDILITDSQSHTIGALAFGPDGSLFVSNGDGTSYGRVDPRTTRVQDLTSLSGKVLRIDPITGDGFSDNPFFTGDITDDTSKVYNYGLRNPFRMAVDPLTGVPYVGDVGWNSWEEINGGRGENFGWPFYEGGASNGSQGGDGVNRETGGYRDLAEAQAFYASNPIAEPPVWSRSHSAGGVAIVLGDFYTGDTFPDEYDNALFFTDFGDPTIRSIKFDAQGEIESTGVVMGSVGSVVEMTMGPDDAMYFVDINGSVGRIEYVPESSSSVALLSGDSIEAPTQRQGFRPTARGEASQEAGSPAPIAYAFAQAPTGRSFAPAQRATLPAASADSFDQALALLLLDSGPDNETSRPGETELPDRERDTQDEAADEAFLGVF